MFAAIKAGKGRSASAAAVISFAQTAGGAAGQSFSINKPASVSAGDVLLAVVAASNQIFNLPAGWTSLYNNNGTAGALPSTLIAIRTLSAGDAGTTEFTFSLGPSNGTAGGTIVAIKNAAFLTAGPANTYAGGGTPLSATAPAVQADNVNSLLFIIATTAQAGSNNLTPQPVTSLVDHGSIGLTDWKIWDKVVPAASTGDIKLEGAGGVSGNYINLIFKPTK